MIRAVGFACATALAAATIVPCNAAFADQKKCVLDQLTAVLKCTLIASSAPPAEVKLSGDLPLVWKRVPVEVGELTARGIGCVRTNADVLEIGAGYLISLVNTATSDQLYLRFVCTWPGDPAPNPPEAPPSLADFRAANAQVLTLQPSLNPRPAFGGLTGVDTWLWCNDPGPIAAGVNLRGWTAAGEVRLVQVGWQVPGWDGFNATSTSCGSEATPSATWMPEEMGDRSITLTSVWAGSWDLTWNGVPMGTFPLGPLSLTAPALPYQVGEYRGVLTG